jgi:hypothetical protein
VKPSAPAPASEPLPPAFAPKPDPNAKAPPPEPEVTMERVPARPGVSDKGKYDAGIFTTPLTANFSMKEQTIFNYTIPKALEIFEGVYNRRPRNHQEFMSEIIAKNNVHLPVLPPQHRYIYDPERGELMVERPKTGN